MSAPHGRLRRGFTLVEAMIVTAIGGIVLTAILSSFMATQNMLHTAMAESELSLAMREMREKLLFKASPDISGNHYGGLLSGSSLNESEVRGYSSVEMSGHTVGSSLNSTSDSSVRLLVWTINGTKMLINERTPNKDAYARWLWPGSLALADCTSMSDVLGYKARNLNGSNVYRIYLDIGIAADVQMRDGSQIIRRERVTVPILGKLQPMKDSSGRY